MGVKEAAYAKVLGSHYDRYAPDGTVSEGDEQPSIESLEHRNPFESNVSDDSGNQVFSIKRT